MYGQQSCPFQVASLGQWNWQIIDLTRAEHKGKCWWRLDLQLQPLLRLPSCPFHEGEMRRAGRAALRQRQLKLDFCYSEPEKSWLTVR